VDQDIAQVPHAVGTDVEPGIATSPMEPPAPRSGKDGKPVYDQEFFLALARCGNDVWNNWRAENTSGSAGSYIRVTFARVDFRDPENSVIDFSGFVFGDGADLSGCQFGDGPDWRDGGAIRFVPGMAMFAGATFGESANLSGTMFGNFPNLSGATFGDRASLANAIFGMRADLSGATFGKSANLHGATFANYAQLSGATFGLRANLSGAIVGHYANLSGVTFGAGADLSGTIFCSLVDLKGATFDSHASLANATFDHSANLSGAKFGFRSNLSGVAFSHGADLSGVIFGTRANLSRASFGESANLSRALFVGEADLRGQLEAEWNTYRSNFLSDPRYKDRFEEWTSDRKQKFLQWPKHNASRPDTFSSISFADARFRGPTDFSGRTLHGRVDFTSARFGQPPRFDSMADADFYGAKIGFASAKAPWVRGWTVDSDVANRLRHLRKLAEDSRNYDLERDLYIEERKAERGIYFKLHLTKGWNDVRQRWRSIANVWSGAAFPLLACLQIVLTASRLLIHLGWISVMFVYWLLADYGRSILRPAVALILSAVLFHAAYWFTLRPQSTPNLWPRITAAMSHAITWPAPNDTPFVRAIRAFSLANAIPFIGALTLDKEIKERLICGDLPVDEKKAADQGVPPCVPIPSLRFQMLALLQTIISALCVFFIALALRNYFRVR